MPGWGQGGRQAAAAALIRRLGWVVGDAGSGVAPGTLGRTPGCPLPPILQGRHHCVCKLEQPNFSQIPESALCVGTIKYRAELGRCPERPPAGQKYVLAAPTGTSLLRAKRACSPSGRGRAALNAECLTGNRCTQKFVFRTGIESCPGWGALWQRKPDH